MADPAGPVRGGVLSIEHLLDEPFYQQSLARPEHRTLGCSVGEVWQQLLRHPDRFVALDSAISSTRRSPRVSTACATVTGLFATRPSRSTSFEVDDGESSRGELGFHGCIERHDDRVDLVLDREKMRLHYPFHLDELRALTVNLAAGQG